jgi:DNA-binding CsgD family transcriptional regulator/PAS domain-containing protein
MENELLATIDDIYAAGLDAELWPRALSSITHLVGGVGATFEILDRRHMTHLDFVSVGIPPANEIAYLDQYMRLNPRIPHGLMQRAGEITWDYGVLDEKGIDQSTFYGEFLAPMDLRYAVAGILEMTDTDQFGAFAVQRSRRQGHVERAEIAIVERLVPHFSRSVDMSLKLKTERNTSRSLEHALDWLADGVALVRADGSIAYSNDSFQAVTRAQDGLGVKKNFIEFALPAARARFDAALAGVLALNNGSVTTEGADFAIARPSGAAPYVLSVRPLKPPHERGIRPAVAIVFVRNPPERGTEDIHLLRELFQFTNAEANLALALRQGVSLATYARKHAVSQNTVYTHLRRIREKTGCHRLPELIGKLNDVRMLLRHGRNGD